MEERHLLSARRAAELIRAELDKGDLDFAYRTLMQALSHLRAATTTEEIKDFMIQPRTTGDMKWDTFLAASIGRECSQLGVSRPSWTDPEPLATEWHPGTAILSEGFKKLIERNASPFMKHYNIIIRDKDFTTA